MNEPLVFWLKAIIWNTIFFSFFYLVQQLVHWFIDLLVCLLTVLRS